MFYKLLNGNFSISSIQLLASKVIETEKDEGNWGAPLAQKGKEKLLGTHGWQKLNSSLFILCINTKRENTLHLVKREKRVLKQNYILPLSPYPPPKIHTLSHTLNSDNATTHVGCSKECAASIPESCKKNIFMNQFTKTHVPGFQIEQRAGNEWENRESWPRPFLALLLQSRILAPKWTFRKSSQRERASQSLFILLEGKKNIQRKAWWKGLPAQDASKPLALSRTSGQCLWRKQDAHFPSSSIFSHPPPPTYINWQWQADRKRAVP